jgi:hypothetical protein
MAESLSLDGSEPEAYLSLAEAELRSGRLEAAEDCLRFRWARLAGAADRAWPEGAAPSRTPQSPRSSQPSERGRSPEHMDELENRFIWSLANVMLSRGAIGGTEAAAVSETGRGASGVGGTAAQYRELIRQLEWLSAPAAQTNSWKAVSCRPSRAGPRAWGTWSGPA